MPSVSPIETGTKTCMNLNDLLTRENIDPRPVLVLRHRPHEPALNKVLPWLAAEKPDGFNAYQQTQVPKLERTMARMTPDVAFLAGQAA